MLILDIQNIEPAVSYKLFRMKDTCMQGLAASPLGYERSGGGALSTYAYGGGVSPRNFLATQKYQFGFTATQKYQLILKL